MHEGLLLHALRRAVLRHAVLRRAVLRRAVLRHAVLRGAVQVLETTETTVRCKSVNSATLDGLLTVMICHQNDEVR